MEGIYNYLMVVAMIGSFLTIGWVLLYVIKRYISSFARKTSTTLDDEIVKAINLPVCVIFAFLGFLLSMPYIERYIAAEHLSLVKEFYDIAIVGLIGLIAYKAFHVVVVGYGSILAKRTQTRIDDVLIPVIGKLGKIIIVVLVFLVIMSTFGIDVTAPLAGMGIAGLAFAFAAQDTISNFLAGFFLMADRPFMVGDTIQLPTGEICEVTDIGVRRSKLYDINTHNQIIVPNLDFSKWKIVNWDLPDKRLRLTLPITVTSDQDPENVKSILLTVVGDCSYVAKTPKQDVFLVSIASTNNKFELVFWVEDHRHRSQALDEINRHIRKAFIERGIKLA